MGVVIIPSDYERLPEASRRTIIPIYIESEDRHGNPIDPAWFERGVVPIHRELIDLAGQTLGDRRMVSDIVQPSVHKVWERYGCNLGERPHGRIWRRAIWEARDLAAGGWRERKGRILSWTLDQIDREIPSGKLVEQDWVALQDRRILLSSMKKAMKRDGAEQMVRVHELLIEGHNWTEIGGLLGISIEAIKRRFYRHAKRMTRASV